MIVVLLLAFDHVMVGSKADLNKQILGDRSTYEKQIVRERITFLYKNKQTNQHNKVKRLYTARTLYY